MKMKRSKKTLSLILCMVLIVAMAQFTIGCNDKTNNATSKVEEGNTQENVTQKSEEQISLGEGEKTFLFTVVEKDGNQTVFQIHTNQTIVGEALSELGLLEGEEGEYGLFVKKVNGITADYNTDGTYWAFYINDEYAQTGVDVTEITEGDSYAFKVE